MTEVAAAVAYDLGALWFWGSTAQTNVSIFHCKSEITCILHARSLSSLQGQALIYPESYGVRLRADFCSFRWIDMKGMCRSCSNFLKTSS